MPLLSRALLSTTIVLGPLAMGCSGSATKAVAPSADAAASEDASAPRGDAGVAPKMDANVTAADGGVSSPTPEAGAAPIRDGSLPTFPQVVDADGGVQASQSVVAIFFSNDDPAILPQLEQVYTGIGATSYWKAAAEYGVGPSTAKTVVLATAAPASIDDTSSGSGNTALQTWLLGEISAGTLPAATPNTTYMINYPASTTVTANGNQCTDFGGYHEDLQDASGELISYGVIPRCTDQGSTVLQTFSASVSHELIESASDPFPNYQPAWYEADDAHLFFDLANGGSELGDMCENDPEAYYQFSDFNFVVQRFWSNKSAMAGHDPCVPAIPGSVFFNAVPELPDTGSFAYYGTTVQVSSVSIPVGSTKTVYFDLYSDGPTADWTVNVMDFNVFYGGAASTALLDIAQPVTQGNDGTRLAADITVKAAGSASATNEVANAELFAIVSTQATGANAPTHYWYGIVTN